MIDIERGRVRVTVSMCVCLCCLPYSLALIESNDYCCYYRIVEQKKIHTRREWAKKRLTKQKQTAKQRNSFSIENGPLESLTSVHDTQRIKAQLGEMLPLGACIYTDKIYHSHFYSILSLAFSLFNPFFCPNLCAESINLCYCFVRVTGVTMKERGRVLLERKTKNRVRELANKKLYTKKIVLSAV